jgi:hypothetical protein
VVHLVAAAAILIAGASVLFHHALVSFFITGSPACGGG